MTSSDDALTAALARAGLAAPPLQEPDDPLAAAGLVDAVRGGAATAAPAAPTAAAWVVVPRAAAEPASVGSPAELPRWPDGAATAVGSMPGTDPVEAAATVVGELALLPHLPELPARGVGADMIGRTAALLVDLAVELRPSAYRVAARPGGDHRRAVDLLRFDLDAIDDACATSRPDRLKVQAAGPWTLVAAVELRSGHQVLTDRGAVREFTASLTEGLRAHVAEVTARTGAQVMVQLDEPGLPAVLAGSLPTPSGYGSVPAVPEPEVQDTLGELVAALDVPVVVHCCAPRPPLGLLVAAGATGVGLDATQPADSELLDAVGQAWEAGVALLLGLVPALAPAGRVTASELARPAFELAARLGFDRERLPALVVPTPTCGLAGASPQWAHRALTLCRELGEVLLDPPQTR